MEHQKRNDDQEQLEAHSLPGINQAGKGPGECDEKDKDAETRTDREGSSKQEE